MHWKQGSWPKRFFYKKMIRKGKRISVRLILLCFIFLNISMGSFLLSFLGFDLSFFIERIQSMLLGKGIHFLFSRLGLGWFGIFGFILISLLSEDAVCWMEAPDSGSAPSARGDVASSSLQPNPFLGGEGTSGTSNPPLFPDVHDEVSQDDLWHSLEEKEEQELRNSKEWKLTERHLLRIENRIGFLGQRAKEIALQMGFSSERCEAVEDAAKSIAEEVADLPENKQLRFLGKLQRELNNPDSDFWERIESEVLKWRSWEKRIRIDKNGID